MNVWVTVLQIIIALLLGVSILLQSKSSGLGTAFGGSSANFSSRRGAEKILYRFTVILAFLFLLIPLLSILLGK